MKSYGGDTKPLPCTQGGAYEDFQSLSVRRLLGMTVSPGSYYFYFPQASVETPLVPMTHTSLKHKQQTPGKARRKMETMTFGRSFLNGHIAKTPLQYLWERSQCQILIHISMGSKPQNALPQLHLNTVLPFTQKKTGRVLHKEQGWGKAAFSGKIINSKPMLG